MIKTRFAPSPTGDLHIGSLRTALFAYLFAKKNNGQFLLRIEDTDQARYQEGSVDSILNGLSWAGITADNQNDVVYQSSRVQIHQKYAKQLVEQGHAYYCFCTPERLAQMRHQQETAKQAPKYDRTCLKLSTYEIQQKLEAGEPYVIRMKIPDQFHLPTGCNQGLKTPTEVGLNSKIIFKDLIRGQVEFDLKEIDDQVLLKSDGYPTYHLANVIDDHEMGITHVIRAEEWLSSTPKHILLYQMFGWDLPSFAHIPMVLAPDKSKLSKRHGATSVLEFKKLGFLPEALINFIALLGWNPGTDQEIFRLEALEHEFDLSKVQKAGAIFNTTKLEWMNSEYIKQLSIENFVKRCLPYLIEANLIDSEKYDEHFIQQVVALEQTRIKKLSEIAHATKYFFKEIEYDKKLLAWRKSTLAAAKEKLIFLEKELKNVPEENWTRSGLEQFIMGLIASYQFETGDVLWPMRVALSGRDKSPSPFEIAEVLGKETSLERIKQAINLI